MQRGSSSRLSALRATLAQDAVDLDLNRLATCLRGYFKDPRYFGDETPLPTPRHLGKTQIYGLEFEDPACRKLTVRMHADAGIVRHEFKLSAALHGHSKHARSVPVAQPHVMIEDATLVGAPFYVSDFIDGRAMRDSTTPDERKLMHGAIIDTVATMHSLDYAALGLGAMGGGSGSVGGALARATAAATVEYLSSSHEALMHSAYADPMEFLSRWLVDALPSGDDDLTRLVHGRLHVDQA